MSIAVAAREPIIIVPAEWSGGAGERWAANLDKFEAMLAMVGDALITHADFAPGESVVEIGCGGGAVSRAIAAKVGPEGRVTGVDISPALTAVAAERSVGMPNVSFVTADAGAATLADAPFDRLTSRFGIMFFRDPPGAFANLHAQLRSGGRADFAVWASAEENKWVSALMAAAGRHLNLPKPVPRSPGPFALEDTEYFAGLLSGAGFKSITVKHWQGDLPVGGVGSNAYEAAAFAMNSASLAEVVAEQSPEIQAAIRADLVKLFLPFEGPEGVLMPAGVWLVTATA